MEEAIELANDTEFGLQDSAITPDITKALRTAYDIEAGGVVINSCGAFRPGNIPFGGFKKSGIGRESLVSIIEKMTEEKTIIISGINKNKCL